VALNPIGYALIGPIAGSIGMQEALIGAAILNVATCVSVVLVPSVQAIRGQVETPGEVEPMHDHAAHPEPMLPPAVDD
jgi:hypothetical protein